MGINLFSDETNDYSPPNPNPSNFSSIKRKFVGQYEIAEVYYPGCTTFDGRKLLLLRRHLYEIQSKKIDWKNYGPTKLDPHLLGLDHIVMARFEPTKEGWMLAELCAKQLIKQEERSTSNQYVFDEMYCTNCKEYTGHLCKYSYHERDSSGDHFICQKCKWEYNGYSGKYERP